LTSPEHIAETQKADHGELVRLNEAFVAAVQNGDVGFFEEHLTPDFLNSNPDGSLKDRDGFLAQTAQPVTIKGLHAVDVLIRILGDVAIIHGATRYTKPDGSEGRGRYTDIWAKRAGRWLTVAAHVTRG